MRKPPEVIRFSRHEAGELVCPASVTFACQIHSFQKGMRLAVSVKFARPHCPLGRSKREKRKRYKEKAEGKSYLKLVMGENYPLEEFLAVAVEAAKNAGEIIRKGFHQKKQVEHKGQVDLVTETDKACEDLIFNLLKQQYPDHKFIGEETSAAFGTAELTDDPTWMVDPLDGTTNFVHGYPFVCVSIGLTIERIPTVGVVYNPIINELFTGIRGKGAFLNGNSIKASSQNELVKSLLATEVGTKRDEATVNITTNRIKNLIFKVRSLRMSGSCALNLCGVACGRLDLCYEFGFGGPWDIAGGAVIVQEAGGLVFDPSGGNLDIMGRKIAATNAHLKDKLVAELKGTE